MTIRDMLQMVVDQEASDLHLIAGTVPTLRVHGQLMAIPNEAALLPQDMEPDYADCIVRTARISDGE